MSLRRIECRDIVFALPEREPQPANTRERTRNVAGPLGHGLKRLLSFKDGQNQLSHTTHGTRQVDLKRLVLYTQELDLVSPKRVGAAHGKGLRVGGQDVANVAVLRGEGDTGERRRYCVRRSKPRATFYTNGKSCRDTETGRTEPLPEARAAIRGGLQSASG